MSLTPSIIGTENTGKFLQTSPNDAMMLILTMEASFGDVSRVLESCGPILHDGTCLKSVACCGK